MAQYVAYSLEQAGEFFNDYQVGPVECKNGEERQLCSSYQEAEQFYNGTEGSTENPPE